MRSPAATDENRLLCLRRGRLFAVPPSMIDTATARRSVGDWAGACAAARVDADLDLRAVRRAHGLEIAARLRDDLRHLAPDLLRWHLPRIMPDGLLRPGLTTTLARYPGGPHLVARTAPGWAEAGQRISLALWPGGQLRPDPDRHPSGSRRTAGPDRSFRPDPDRHPSGSRRTAGPDRSFRPDSHRDRWDAELWERGGPARRSRPDSRRHPSDAGRATGPDRRFRLDLHRHLWDSRRAPELRERGGGPERWPAEAAILARADGIDETTVLVRLGARHWVRLDGAPATATRGGPVLPHAATWTPPDVDLLRAGLIDPGDLHPLVAAALAPGAVRPARKAAGHNEIDCRGARHRIGLVDGRLVPLDHDPVEIRREELLAALGGPPLPCLRAIDRANRHPESLDDVRGLLDHGDVAGAAAAIEALLGPGAVLREGALRDELEAAALRRVDHGLYRNGFTGRCPPQLPTEERRTTRTHPRHATPR